MAIVTISRQIGSGGDEIAVRLAQELQFTLVDHTLLVELLQAQGLSKSDLDAFDGEEFDEAPQSREQNRVYVDLLPTLITDLASEKDLVVLGFGGRCIFRGVPGALHVRVVAGTKERIRRLMDERGMDEQAAVRLVDENDEARRGVIRYHYGEDIDNTACYDLVVNTDRLSVETTVRLIQHAVELVDFVGKERTSECWPETARPPSFAHPSEEEFTKVLDFYQIRWEYEPRTFPLAWDEAGNATEAFSPDFYLVDFDLFIELTTLKQSLVTEKNRKIRRFRELYPEVTLKVFYGRDYRSLLGKYGLAQKSSSK
jgi:cytidylate kinase